MISAYVLVFCPWQVWAGLADPFLHPHFEHANHFEYLPVSFSERKCKWEEKHRNLSFPFCKKWNKVCLYLIRLPTFAIDVEFRDIKDIIQVQPCSSLPALKCQGRWKVDILYWQPLHSMHSKETKPACQKHLYTRVYCRIIHDGQDMEPNCVHWWKNR